MDVRSVLLSAGHGVRLRPLTRLLPKPAMPVLDVPLAAFGLRALALAAPPVVVNLGPLAEAARGALEPHAARDEVDFLVEAPAPYGTGGTLATLRTRVSEHVVTWNADVVADVDLRELIDLHSGSGVPATLAVRRVEAGADLRVRGRRAVELVDRRVEPRAAGARFLGVAVIDRAALDLLPEARPAGLAEALLRPLAAAGGLALHEHHGYWIDAGTPSRYLRLSLDVLSGRAPWPRTPGRVLELEGGHAYLGPSAAAAPASLQRGAILLAGSRAEPGARVERSIVWPGEVVTGGQLLQEKILAGGRALPAR